MSTFDDSPYNDFLVHEIEYHNKAIAFEKSCYAKAIVSGDYDMRDLALSNLEASRTALAAYNEELRKGREQ